MEPEDWTRKELGQIVERVSRRGGDDLPVLTVSKDLGIVLQTEKFDRILASDDRSRYKRVRRGEFAYDPMLLWSGSIARQKRVPEGVVSPAYYVFTVNDEEVDPEYFEHFITADRMNTYYEAISEGTNKRRRKARFKDFSALEFPFPPITEQESIAAILSTVDDAIATTRKVIEQTKRLKKGLLQDLMTFGIGHTHFKETEIGEIPEEWEVVRLGDLANTQEGLFVDGDWIETKDQDPEGEVRLIQLADIGRGQFLDNSNRWLTLDTAKELGCTFLKARDILIARMPDPIGRACTLPDLDYRAVTAVDVAICRPPAFVDRTWLRLLLNTDRLLSQISRFVSGTTRKRISRKNLQRIAIPLPPVHEQEEIAKAVQPTERYAVLMRHELSGLQVLKCGLMQDLFTGRVRVPVD